MLKLYGRLGSGSVAVEAVLAELGLAYDLALVERGDPGLLKLNPKGQVPVLVLENGTVLSESAAICIQLADLNQGKHLAPSIEDRRRPAYLRWMLFMAANIYSTDLLYYYPDRYTNDPAGVEGVKSAAEKALSDDWDILAQAIGKGPYILGDDFSVADIYAAMLATWGPNVTTTRHRNLKALYDRVAARPAINPIFRRNDMPA